jgi:Flp pilus assembly protein TadG
MNRWRSYPWQCRRWLADAPRRTDGWTRDDSGASAVEFALVAPLLIGLLLGVIEYGSLAMVQMRMNDTARDTARRLAVRDLKSEAEGEQFALARLADWDAAFRAQVTLPKFPERDIAVTIKVSMEDAAIMNLVNFGMDGDMTTEVHMVME